MHSFFSSTVDDNEVYDNTQLREQDEEEKYFDAESPEARTDSPQPQNQDNENESEDELDKYMRSLKVNEHK